MDSHTIASMIMSDVNLKSYSDTSYHNEELKSLTRYRFDKVKERAKLKSSVSRLVCILFPELEKLVPQLHIASVYALLSEFPSAHAVASAHLTRLTHLLSESSKGRYGKDMAIIFREAARNSIGSNMPAKSLELKHTIKLIRELTSEIDEIEIEIKSIMDEINSPILTIPGISYRMGAMIIAEIGDFNRFDSADKILAYAGMSPSTYQSGQLDNCYSHMEKRGSRYLRYALYNATKRKRHSVCHAVFKHFFSVHFMTYDSVEFKRKIRRRKVNAASFVFAKINVCRQIYFCRCCILIQSAFHIGISRRKFFYKAFCTGFYTRIRKGSFETGCRGGNMHIQFLSGIDFLHFVLSIEISIFPLTGHTHHKLPVNSIYLLFSAPH